MAKSSTHIESGNTGYFSHNSRESFTQSQVFFDESNEVDRSKKETFKLFRSAIDQRSAAYEKRVGQKLQSKTVTQLSAIVNLEQHHILDDLQPIINFIEDRLDTKVIQRAIHRDEGKLVHKITGQTLTSGEQFFCNPSNKKLYFDQKYKEPIDMNQWKIEKNYHAHLEMLGINSIGKSIRRNLTTTFFRELQDITAQTLGMERGNKVQSYTKEQMQQITSSIGDKSTYSSDKAYASAFTAKAKELGIYINKYASKRKSTQQYKQDKAIENKAAIEATQGIKAKITKSNKAKIATIKQLKELNKELRADLQQSGGTREDYAKLEEEIRQLKQKIKDKELTEEALNLKTEELSNAIINKASQIDTAEKHLLDQIEEREALKTEVDIKEQTLADQEEKISNLEAQNQTLSNLAYTTEDYWIGEKDNLTETETVSYFELYKRATNPERQKRYEYLENKIEEYRSEIICIEEKLRLKKSDIKGQEKELKKKEKEILALKDQNKELEAKIATLPSSDIVEELNMHKIDAEQNKNEHLRLQFLAKKRYEVSETEKQSYALALDEKKDEIVLLNKGYSKIETALFGESKNRPVEEITQEINILTSILSNVSKYFKLSKQKIKALFSKGVPEKKELEKDPLTDIPSALEDENNFPDATLIKLG